MKVEEGRQASGRGARRRKSLGRRSLSQSVGAAPLLGLGDGAVRRVGRRAGGQSSRRATNCMKIIT